MRQLAAIEAATFPWMEERVRARVVHDLRWSMLTPEEQGEAIESNWASLRQQRGLVVH